MMKTAYFIITLFAFQSAILALNITNSDGVVYQDAKVLFNNPTELYFTYQDGDSRRGTKEPFQRLPLHLRQAYKYSPPAPKVPASKSIDAAPAQEQRKQDPVPAPRPEPAAPQIKKPAGNITESELMDPASWTAGSLPGVWQPMSVAPKSKILRLQDACTAFGCRPQSVFAYYDGSTLRNIEIVCLEQGKAMEEQRMDPAAFRKRFEELSKTIPAALSGQFGREGEIRHQGQNAVLMTKMLQWASGSFFVRLEAIPDQLISIHIMPSSENRSYSFMSTASLNRKVYERAEEAKSNVITYPNGDVIISNLPMVEQGERGYCAVGVLAMVSQYFGLLLSIDSLSAKARYQTDAVDYYSGMEAIYSSVAQEAKLACYPADIFDFNDMRQYIKKGCPVIVWRIFNYERDRYHTEFVKTLEADPNAKMHAPLSIGLLRWSGHASVINGFNAERKEVIFTESWGENKRNRRMPADEMLVTAVKIYYFAPKE